MLLSISLIVLSSLFLSSIFEKLRLPRILGILLAGIIIGPFVLDWIHPDILDLSVDLRQVALIVILVRAGLSLDVSDLKKVGRSAILLSFVPATFELIAITLLAPLFFGITYLEAAIMGSIVAAVSPAVVVPRMIELIKKKQGGKHQVPQLILAGASLDDVYVIVLFMSFLQAYAGGSFSFLQLVMIPLSVILGALLGFGLGILLVRFFKKFHVRDTVKVLVVFAVAFLVVSMEELVKPYVSISGLIAVLFMGIAILYAYDVLAKRLVGKFEKIWVVAEIMLFVLVGASLDPWVAWNAGFLVIILIFSALSIRIVGVFVALIASTLERKERLYVAVSYLPKATVQAAIGAIPLSMGIPSGELILAVAVVSIVISAPLGAILMDKLANRLLNMPHALPILAKKE